MPDLEEHFNFIGHTYRANLNLSPSSHRHSQNSNFEVQNNQTLDAFLNIEPSNANTQQGNGNQQVDPPLRRTNLMNFDDINANDALGDPLANFHLSNSNTQVSSLLIY